MLAKQINTITEVKIDNSSNVAIESKLQRMAAIKYQLETLQNEFDRLKEDVIQNHFINNELFADQNGVVLATYSTSIRQMFDSTKFKKEHPKTYDDYSNLKEIKTFKLK